MRRWRKTMHKVVVSGAVCSILHAHGNVDYYMIKKKAIHGSKSRLFSFQAIGLDVLHGGQYEVVCLGHLAKSW